MLKVHLAYLWVCQRSATFRNSISCGSGNRRSGICSMSVSWRELEQSSHTKKMKRKPGDAKPSRLQWCRFQKAIEQPL